MGKLRNGKMTTKESHRSGNKRQVKSTIVRTNKSVGVSKYNGRLVQFAHDYLLRSKAKLQTNGYSDKGLVCEEVSNKNKTKEIADSVITRRLRARSIALNEPINQTMEESGQEMSDGSVRSEECDTRSQANIRSRIGHCLPLLLLLLLISGCLATVFVYNNFVTLNEMFISGLIYKN